jgi:hypothetical protein
MSNETGRSVIIGAVVACASGWSLPAAADAPAPARSTIDQLHVIGETLSGREMSDLRGAYSRATIRVNGTTYTTSDPAATGSATLTIPLGTRTFSRVSASTTGGGTATSTVTITGPVTFRTSP